MPTPVPELNAVLRELAASASAVLAGNFLGVWLQGSFALGDWDAHSDVDFIIGIQRDVTDAELPALQALHGRLHELPSHWARRLDGSYLPLPILRRAEPARTPLLYLDNGSRALVRSDHDNTLVVRWVLREHGIALDGPPARELIEPVPAASLTAEVRATLREWGAELLADPDRMNSSWYQSFVVLSYCRMLHTLATGRVNSKPAGAVWALSQAGVAFPVPFAGEFRGLVERALAGRGDPALTSRQPAGVDDLRLTRDFIRWAVALSSQEV
jgi:hypothetical protein